MAYRGLVDGAKRRGLHLRHLWHFDTERSVEPRLAPWWGVFPVKLFLEFKATKGTLLFSWGMLLLLWIASALLTAVVLRMQDVQT
jgi:hypothetical protein